MGVLDLISAPFKALGNAYDDAQYGAGWQQRQEMEAQDRADKQRRQAMADKLAQVQAQQNLFKEATGLAAGASTPTNAPEEAAKPLEAGTDQVGPVAPKYNVDPSFFASLPPELRKSAYTSALNQKQDAVDASNTADALNQAKIANYESQGTHRENQDKNAQGKMALQQKNIESMIQSRTRPKMYAPRLVKDENGNQFFVDPVQALGSGASWSSQLPAAMLDEKAQTTASADWGKNLLKEIPALRDKLGPFMGRKNAVELMLGSADPDVAGFARDLASLSALQPKIHGMRGQRAMEDFSKGLELSNNPDALAAGIQSYINLANTVSGSKDKVARPGTRPNLHGGAPARKAKTASGVEYEVQD